MSAPEGRGPDGPYARPKFRPEGNPLDLCAEHFSAHPFATLIAQADPLHAVHTPVLVAPDADGLTLRAHVARANPFWKRVEAHPEILAISLGPHAAISASWYAEPSAGTWNYTSSHAQCEATTVHDEAALRPFLERLTRTFETDSAYRVDEDVMTKLVPAIVGIDCRVVDATTIVKMSQNKTDATHANIVAGLASRDHADDAAVATIMRNARVPWSERSAAE